MAAVLRVGTGFLVESRYQRDVLEEIRIMAEAAQASLRETTEPVSRAPSSFTQYLRRVLARPALH